MGNPKEVNILLFGETGAGKSTTVNALANYLKFTTFDEALNSVNDYAEIVSSTFTLPNRETGEEVVIRSGPVEDSGEFGESLTRAPDAYKFTCGDHILRIIDTPGIGDSSGTVRDSQNFEKIFTFLQRYKNLNAILFILRGNDARKTTFFKYCISELLTHLHKNVAVNIIFCFTYSKSSDYGPGDGFSTLKSFLENEIEEIKLKLTPNKNCFFIDSEAHRYLVAKRKVDYNIREQLMKSCAESWIESLSQIEKMFRTIVKLPPHPLHDMLNLNVVRKVITQLTQPMIKMQQTINENITNLLNYQKKLKSSTDLKESLTSRLHVDIWDLQMKKLDYPCTVCTSSKCIEILNVEGEEKINYKTVCHDNCKCWWVDENVPGGFFLKLCEASEYHLGYIDCKRCRCSWDKHMHITSELVRVKRTVIDKDMQNVIENKTNEIQELDELCASAEQKVKEYKEEFEIIQETGAKFVYILNDNSYFKRNRYFDQYIEFLINEESKKTRPNLQPLYKMKRDHQVSVDTLTEDIKRDKNIKVRFDDVPLFKEILLNLKHSGPNFRQILETIQLVQDKQQGFYEKTEFDFSDNKAKLAEDLKNWLQD